MKDEEQIISESASCQLKILVNLILTDLVWRCFCAHRKLFTIPLSILEFNQCINLFCTAEYFFLSCIFKIYFYDLVKNLHCY